MYQTSFRKAIKKTNFNKALSHDVFPCKLLDEMEWLNQFKEDQDLILRGPILK